MPIEHRIELYCRRSDARTFAQLKFVTTTTTKPGDHSAGINMTSPDVDELIVSTLVGMALQGYAFTARVLGFDRLASLLIASDGKDVITVPTIGYWREPAVGMDQDGHCVSDDARKYWALKANFENGLVREEVRA